MGSQAAAPGDVPQDTGSLPSYIMEALRRSGYADTDKQGGVVQSPSDSDCPNSRSQTILVFDSSFCQRTGATNPLQSTEQSQKQADPALEAHQDSFDAQMKA